MKSQKQLFLSWLYRTEFGSRILDFEDVLYLGAQDAFGYDAPDAESLIDSSIKRFWSYLLKQNEADIDRGVTPLFHVIDKERFKLIATSAHRIGMPAKSDRRLGICISARPAIVNAIDALNDRGYEALGCVAAHLAGAVRTKLTPRGNEGGIDFIALIKVPGVCHLFSGNSGPLRIIGQSKKHSSKIDVGMVRGFASTMSDVHKQSPGMLEHLPPWFRSARGPIVGWIVSHQGFQSGAADYAKNHGIVISDTIDIAEIAAKARSISSLLAPGDRAAVMGHMIQGVLS